MFQRLTPGSARTIVTLLMWSGSTVLIHAEEPVHIAMVTNSKINEIIIMLTKERHSSFFDRKISWLKFCADAVLRINV